MKILCEFIDLNGGSIQIVSDAGYWQRKNKKTVTKPLRHLFPGTVVSVEIDTSDRQVYTLTSESKADNIF